MTDSNTDNIPRRITKNTLLAITITRAFSALNLAIKFGFPAWAITEIFSVAAGQTTVIHVMSNAFDALGPSALELIIGGLLIAWAVGENFLRRHKTKSLSGRILELEGRLDPGRESSGLTSSGATNPEDRE
jgi:hypothetical protein